MNLQFNFKNDSFQLTKVGSAAFTLYAIIGVAVIGVGATQLAEYAIVKYKRRINRKINQK
jgi:hypothetical protein